MLHISVTGFAPKGWTSGLGAQIEARKLANAARSAPGCLNSGTFRHNGKLFVFTVWEGHAQMRFFETSALCDARLGEMSRSAAPLGSQAFVNRIVPRTSEMARMWHLACATEAA